MISIPFEEFHMAVDLPDKRLRFRSDGVVENMDEHQESVIEEFGLKNASISSDGDLSPTGRTMSWVDHKGTHWTIIFIIENADLRITKAILTHEKYHALCRLAPERLPVLHDAVQALGFSIDWDRYDEEMRASITQVASLYAQGVPLEALAATGKIAQALDVARTSMQLKTVDTSP